MASHEELSRWVLKNAEALNLQALKLDWIYNYFKETTDISVKIEVESNIYSGRGSDRNPDLALMKGVTEAIERFVCAKNMISSVGVAGHYCLDHAKENSFLEFIERFAIWFHFNQEVGMNPIDPGQETKDIFINTKDHGAISLKVHHFQMDVPEGFFGVFTLAEGTDAFNIGGIMGAAVARSLEEAHKKSSIECFRNVAALATHTQESITIKEFRKILNPSSHDSQKLLFNKSYCKDLLKILFNKRSEKKIFVLSLEKLIFTELGYATSVLRDCPLKFTRCLDQDENPAPDTEFVG